MGELYGEFYLNKAVITKGQQEPSQTNIFTFHRWGPRSIWSGVISLLLS